MSHIVNGKFQSDKYPTCPAGKVPLSVNDREAQPLLWLYAQRRRAVDADFADDLEIALIAAGFTYPGFDGAFDRAPKPYNRVLPEQEDRMRKAGLRPPYCKE